MSIALTKSATLLRKMEPGSGWKYDAWFFRLSEPAVYQKMAFDKSDGTTEFIIVSSRPAASGKPAQTLVFASNSECQIRSGFFLAEIKRADAVQEALQLLGYLVEKEGQANG